MAKTQNETVPTNHLRRKEMQEEYPWTISYLLQDIKMDIRDNARRIDSLRSYMDERFESLGLRIDNLRSNTDTPFDSPRSDMDKHFREVMTLIRIGFTIIGALIVVLHFVK